MANGNVKDYVKKNQPNITTRLKFIITDIEPFSSDKETVNVLKSLMLGKPPGSINLLDNLVRPDNDHICNLIMKSLKPLVQACWSSDPAKRPASSDILDCFVSEAEKGPSDGRPLKQTKDYSQVNPAKAASASRMAIAKALPSRQAPAFTTLAPERFNKRPLASTPTLTRVAVSSCTQLIGPLPSGSSTKSGIGHRQHPLPGTTTSCRPGQGNGARGKDGNQERENALKKGWDLDTRGRYLQLPKSAKSSAGQVDRKPSNRQSNLPAKD
ncbi:hypothetical protein FRC01_009393 [Tulasnella sp. 417]|nr:hypothetical protein FRC01_009393 [Tulasnella sp. 417]